ncbi:helix-turn-helix domain-containing protein [Kitasatospora indigofera]|uniref:helix-turn-helix domain-containing protein n=1 Tax=Kitasatospora indigofera TaxID=67307 RepID=UPI0033BBFA72
MSESTRLLVRRLREIKDANNWSLAETARRTHFSKASWERWLNGKRLITRQALDSLLKASGANSTELTALYERALAEESSAAPTEPSPGAEAGQVPPGEPDPDAADPDPADPESAADPDPAAADLSPAQSPAPDPGEGDDAEPGRRSGHRTRRRLRAALVAGVGASALLVAALLWPSPPRQGAAGPDPTPSAGTGRPAPAALAPPCQGVGCVGKDPQAGGCAVDARTLLTANVGDRIIYLRYSQRCLAAWAAIKQGAPKDTATITTNSGQQQTAEIHWGYDNYSAMVDASGSDTTLQVCGVQPGGRGCTGVYTDPAHQPWPDPTDTGTPSGSSAPPATSTGSPAAGSPAAGPTG